MSEPLIPKKRTLFTKPSWSKPQPLASDTDLFSRSTHTYVDLAAQAERDHKKKQARKERERARQAASEERSSKRQCISSDADDDNLNSSHERSSGDSENERPRLKVDAIKPSSSVRPMTSPKPLVSPKSLLKRYEAKVAAHHKEIERKSQPSNIVDLEDGGSSDGDRGSLDVAKVKPPNVPDEDEEIASDEEFSELARQARERARRKRLEEDMLGNMPEPAPTATSDGHLERSQSLLQPSPKPSPPDPVLQILITSSIPETSPLLVNRKLSQRLKEVRLAWTQRQGYTPETSDTIFLTWRGKRLFDSTSCRSLGICSDAHGNIKAKDDVLDMDGKLHMEAMTTEMLSAYKKAKLRGTQQDEKEDEAPVQEMKEPGVRIIMKSRHFGDVKVIVQKVQELFLTLKYLQ